MKSTTSSRTGELLLGLAAAPNRDTHALRQDMVSALRRAVPFEAWCWALLDPVGALPSIGAGNSLIDLDISRFVDYEYGSAEGLFRSPPRPGRQATAVTVLSHATYGDLCRSTRWREIYEPHGVGDELRVTLAADGYTWAFLDLTRDRTTGHFTEEEAAFLRSLGPVMARGLRAALTAVTPSAQEAGWGPGTVLVDERGFIRAATPDGEGWIALLRDAEGPPFGVFPSPVTIMCAAARLRYRPEEGPAVRGRLRLPSGPWVAVHASPMNGAAVSPGLVAVTVEAAGAGDVAPLLFHAHGLTPRQRQLADLLLDGLSNKEIARALDITPYTVQDHVKAVLGKLGVRSRQELAACVLSRRL